MDAAKNETITRCEFDPITKWTLFILLPLALCFRINAEYGVVSWHLLVRTGADIIVNKLIEAKGNHILSLPDRVLSLPSIRKLDTVAVPGRVYISKNNIVVVSRRWVG
jgi:hypothetical protein